MSKRTDIMTTMCSADMAWRTATGRTKMSKPARWLHDNHLLWGRLLDYGCGRGKDAEELGCASYDPHFQPVMPKGKFSTIMCNYVLNVLESEDLRLQVVWDIQSRLADDGRAYIAVRANRKDLKGLTRIGTWQGRIKLAVPIVYEDSDTVIYEIFPGTIVSRAPAEITGGADASAS